MSRESTIEVEGLLAVVEDDGWWCIERAHHDGRRWMEKLEEHVFALRSSARVSDADVEGTAEEMIGIAQAIRDRGTYGAKRCAVDATGPRVLLWSPRNSIAAGSVTLEAADDLATKIESKTG